MAAIQDNDGPRPLPKSESLQKMLDLEKRYKLARLQSTQSSPRPNTAASFQPQIRSLPIQTRRRDSRESLFLQHQQQGELSLNSTRRAGPISPLSITIPSTENSEEKDKNSDRGQLSGSYSMAAEDDEQPAVAEDSHNTTPREKAVTLPSTGKEDQHEAYDDAEESDQSSICQSPSWEGYGQKKKDKKKKQESEQRKRDKERMDQELRAAAKKRASNRLFKFPPPDSSDSNRPSSSASFRLDSSSGLSARSGRFTPSGNHALIPEVWGISLGSGSSTQKPRPAFSRAASAVEPMNHATSRGSPAPSKPHSQHSSTDKEKDDISDKVSYPPTSSRSHALRNVAPPSHNRQHSAANVTAAPSHQEEQLSLGANGNTQVYSGKSLSDQDLSYSEEPVMRGRQSAEPIGSGSYVRKARAQSIERSIKGFMQEAALSDPNLLNAPNRKAFSYLGPSPQHHSHQNGQRPTSSRSRRSQSFDRINGPNHDRGDVTVPSKPTVGRLSTQQEIRTQRQQLQKAPPKDEPTQRQQLQQPIPSSAPATASDKSLNTHSTDYFNFVTEPYSPPSLDLATPAGGIFSSIKSRIGRRSSTSSGSTSNTGRSFKERAMGVMHLQSTTSNLAVMSQPPTRKPSQNSSQTTDSAASTAPSIQQEPLVNRTLHKETRRLPKAARVLGEINQHTMSQDTEARSRPSEGSSTSSYHDDSSLPPSPASTPDTSRPQSAKGLSATIEEIRISSPDKFMGGHGHMTTDNKVRQKDEYLDTTNDTLDSSPKSSFPEANNETEGLPTTHSPKKTLAPASRAETARAANVDRPRSKGRILDDLERPSSRGRLLENIERPGSRARTVPEQAKQSEQHGHGNGAREAEETNSNNSEDAEDIILNSAPDLSEGLGILDEAWSQSTITPDNDAQSFVTTLTNQHSTASLKSQHGNMKDALFLAEAQNMLGVHPALIDHGEDPITPASIVDEPLMFANRPTDQQTASENPQPRSNLRKKERRSIQQAKHMSVVNEEPRQVDDSYGQSQRTLPPTTTEASPNVDFLPNLRHEAITPKAAAGTSPSLHMVEQEALASPNKDTVTSAAPSPIPSSSGRSSPSAMYLQEARRSAPLVSSPLSNVIRSAKANLSTPSLGHSGPHLHGTHLPLPAPAPTGANSAKSPTSPKFRIPAHEPEQVAKPIAKPIAKMLVECCHCNFFHDMPSRVYECMAQPDAVVTDRDLGVSGAITTMVKCPWCSHNMSTKCCAGYAAVVYLKERLH